MHKIKILYSETAQPIERATVGAAAYDLCADISEPLMLHQGETLRIPTGISIEMPSGLCAQVLPRSGLAAKCGIRPANTPGLIDSDYRGEIFVALHRDELIGCERPFVVEPGARIAQLLFLHVPQVELHLSQELSSTERGAGGFGSTDGVVDTAQASSKQQNIEEITK